MKEKHLDHPGIYIPPPTYILISFLLAVGIQKLIPISKDFFYFDITFIAGAFFIILSISIGLIALYQFFKTRNTPITHKPANTLQTTGIYSFSRNPMYLGLHLFYIGCAFVWGNWWHFILLPLLILFFEKYIIRKEENYLTRKFGDDYIAYKKKVRRWV